MSDMPIKMCLPVLSSAPKQKHTLGSNLVSELDTILKFRIVSLWVGLRTETLTFQASELEPESKCLEDRIVCHFFPQKDPVDWKWQYCKFLTESETSSRHVVSLKSRNRTRTHVWTGKCVTTLQAWVALMNQFIDFLFRQFAWGSTVWRSEV